MKLTTETLNYYYYPYAVIVHILGSCDSKIKSDSLKKYK